MDTVNLKKTEIEKVRDRINQLITETMNGARCLDDLWNLDNAIQNTVSEYFRDLTGDTQPIDLETMKPCDDESLYVGDHCPNIGCGGRLGKTTEDDLTCPECGLSWGKEAPHPIVSTKPHIVVEVLGGCVTNVTCETHDITTEIKDYDNDPDA